MTQIGLLQWHTRTLDEVKTIKYTNMYTLRMSDVKRLETESQLVFDDGLHTFDGCFTDVVWNVLGEGNISQVYVRVTCIIYFAFSRRVKSHWLQRTVTQNWLRCESNHADKIRSYHYI